MGIGKNRLLEKNCKIHASPEGFHLHGSAAYVGKSDWLEYTLSYSDFHHPKKNKKSNWPLHMKNVFK